MYSTDRPQFESELAILFGGYPTFLTPPRVEAYWRGLQKMQLETFRRCVNEALGDEGNDKLPTINTIWQISRKQRAAAIPQKQVAQQAMHPLQGAANSALLSLLRDRGPASEDCIQQLVAIKNRIVASMPVDADPIEARDVLLGAFEKHWVPMPEAERSSAISRRFGGAPTSVAGIS